MNGLDFIVIRMLWNILGIGDYAHIYYDNSVFFIYGCVPHHVNLLWSVKKNHIDNNEKIIWYYKNEEPFVLNRCQEKNNGIECYETGGMAREVSFIIGSRCQDTCLVEWVVGENVIWRLQLVEIINNGKKKHGGGCF